MCSSVGQFAGTVSQNAGYLQMQQSLLVVVTLKALLRCGFMAAGFSSPAAH